MSSDGDQGKFLCGGASVWASPYPGHHGVGQEPPLLIGNTPLILRLTSPTCAIGRSLADMDVEDLMVKPQH